MRSFNLSALAVRERAITLFFICASALGASMPIFIWAGRKIPRSRSRCSR